MPIFTKLNSIRHSVNNPFASSKHRSTSPPPPSTTTMTAPSYTSSPYSRSSMSASNLSQHYHHHHHQPKRSPINQEPRQRVASTPTASFAETLKVISKQVQQDQFEDVFGSFFFTEKRCQHRATFMAARLLQNLGRTDLVPYYRQQQQHQQVLDPFWKTLIDRFYTLNYLLFVVPPNNPTRTKYLMALEQRMKNDKVGCQLKDQRGGMETYFALYYAMSTVGPQHQQSVSDDIYVVEKACKLLEHCLDSESKLGHTERDAMYIFHSLRVGFHGYNVKVILDDDDHLLALMDEAVQNNKNLAKHPYVNPFEDDACIVDDSDDDGDMNPDGSRQADSGFYDGLVL